MVKLHTQSLDDEPEAREFATKAEAIDAAVRWFLEGYENETINKDGLGLEDDVANLRQCLERGVEFYCGNFYERISIVEKGGCEIVSQ